MRVCKKSGTPQFTFNSCVPFSCLIKTLRCPSSVIYNLYACTTKFFMCFHIMTNNVQRYVILLVELSYINFNLMKIQQKFDLIDEL